MGKYAQFCVLGCALLGGCSGSMPEEGRSAFDCRDGADNDGDGLFDCHDPGCSGSPDCTASSDASVDASMPDAQVAIDAQMPVDAQMPDASADAAPDAGSVTCTASGDPCDYDSECCTDFCDVGLCN